MEPPSGPQQDLQRQMVEHAGDLASTLEAQFASCRTAPEEHGSQCEQCFLIEVTGDVPLLPADTECPLPFAAHIRGGQAPDDWALVLLWHENGRVDSVEISSVLDQDPMLADLQILGEEQAPDLKS